MSENAKIKISTVSLLIIIILLVSSLLVPLPRTINVAEKYWEREIEIEEYKLVEETGESIPEKAVEVLEENIETEYHSSTYLIPIGNTIMPFSSSTPNTHTEYKYTIWKWVPGRTETVSGNDNNPVWPSISLKENEKEVSRKTAYYIIDNRNISYACDENTWNCVNPNERVHVKANFWSNKISKIID